MNTYTELSKAREAAQRAQAKVAELEARAEFEGSFVKPVEGFMVVRRCIDTGRMEKQFGVFMDSKEASRFAAGIAGYGVGKDIFIEPIDVYPSV